MMLFLSGAEMQPERVRAAWPAARFVARARLQPRPDGEQSDIWGILIEAPEARESGEEWQAVTDDGRTITATVLPPDAGDPVAVLAAAKYWELPPEYVQRLADLAAVPVEEYFY